MTGKTKISIGLRLLAPVLLGWGIWSGFGMISDYAINQMNEMLEKKPVMTLELNFVMRGKFDDIYLYEDGGVLHIEEKNLRMPTFELPPTRVCSNGKINAEVLQSLISLFQTEEFTGMGDYYQFSGRPLDPIKGVPSGGFSMGDGSFKFTIDYDGLQKTVAALGFLTPDQGLTYPDMPYPLNVIYRDIKRIIDDKTEEIYSETIRTDTRIIVPAKDTEGNE